MLLLMHPVSPRAISKAKSENCMCKVPLLFLLPVSKHNDADTHQLCVFGNDLRSRRGFARVNLEHSIVSREDDGEQATERISFRS